MSDGPQGAYGPDALAERLRDPAQAPAALAAVVDAFPSALVVEDRSGAVLAANAALGARLGRDPAGLVGRPFAEVLDALATHAEAPERLREVAAAVRSAPRAEGLGSPEHLERSTVRLADSAGTRLLVNAFPVRPEGEPAVGWVWTFVDVSAHLSAREDLGRAQEDLREAQARLVQSEKMASLGMLVAGIAHEINTPIGAVSSMHGTLKLGVDKLSRLLEASLEGGIAAHSEYGKVLGIIEDANRVISEGTERVRTIVRRLRSFARLDEAELKDLSLNQGLEDTLTLIHHELKRDVRVHRDLGALPPVACFPGRLNQVFLNLLMNARQAMPGGGDIYVQSWADEGSVYVSVRDTGTGISQENLQKIFDAGFTTKGVGVGTGLGLSICRQIIAEHFGELSVTSELGVGSTFTVRIPRDVRARHEARRAESSAEPPVS